MRIKIYECPYCLSKGKDIKVVFNKGERAPYNICIVCDKEFPLAIEYVPHKDRSQQRRRDESNQKHKMEKVIETYLDLAETVQRAGGSVSLIKDHRDKPLSKFLEDVCSTNNVRFRHERKD